MWKCFECITGERKAIFVAGAATGLAVFSFLKTKKARDIAVKSVAGTIILKEKIMENVANIREEAEDICVDARIAAREKCDCGGNCGEGIEE